MDKIKISIDAMGGDHGLKVVVPACLRALKFHPNLELILVGKRDEIAEYLKQTKSPFLDRITIHHASEVVEMHESPSLALRNKKDSSMRVAINLVKEGVTQACVSAGNTGALMATSKFVLKTLPGVDRPAIVSIMPSLTDRDVHLLDLGANIDSSPEQLFQFAVMGSILAEATLGIEKPTIALLNVGEEEIKGNMQVKQAAELLSKVKELNYIGFVEGNDIFKGTADVVVCDGFVGNIALKASEGLAKLLFTRIREGFQRNLYTKFAALCAIPVLSYLKRKMDPSHYNGATLVGLTGIVIKSHGSAEVKAYAYAINKAVLEVEKNVTQQIGDKVACLLKELA